MKTLEKQAITSFICRVFIPDPSSSLGLGLAGLSSSSSGLIISTICNNESSATAYTQAGSTIESIATLGTYAAPTATKIRFNEVDSTNHKGLYEIQIADARMAVSNAKSIIIEVSGVSTMCPVRAEIQLTAFDLGSAAPDVNTVKIGGTTQTAGDVGIKTGFALTSAYDPAKTASQAGDAMALTTSERTSMAAAVWNALTLGFVTVGSIGLLLKTNINAALNSLATLAAQTAMQTDVTTLLGRITSARAGYLDNLNVGGVVASHADILAVNQSASKHILITTVSQYERPESGTTTYTVEARTFAADTGAAVNADSTPTLTGTGQTSGSLAANISAATNPATGVYRWTYSVASNATIEPVRFDVSATISATVFTLSCYTQVADFVAVTFTTADRALLTGIDAKTANLPSDPSSASTLAASFTTVNTTLSSINAKTTNLPAAPASQGDVTGSTSSILSKLLKYFQLVMRKDAAIATDNATELTAINANGGSGAGTANNQTDSLEAIRDRGDAAWNSGGGLDAAGMRDALGMAAPNLDTQLADILAASGGGSQSSGTDPAAVVAHIDLNSPPRVSVPVGSETTFKAKLYSLSAPVERAVLAVKNAIEDDDADAIFFVEASVSNDSSKRTCDLEFVIPPAKSVLLVVGAEYQYAVRYKLTDDSQFAPARNRGYIRAEVGGVGDIDTITP